MNDLNQERRIILVTELFDVFGETPRIGAWIDDSDQSVGETVRDILERMDDARILWA